MHGFFIFRELGFRSLLAIYKQYTDIIEHQIIHTDVSENQCRFPHAVSQ